MVYAHVVGGKVVSLLRTAAGAPSDEFILVGEWDDVLLGAAWDGQAFTPAPPPSLIPSEVTMRQARDVLIDMDLIDQVEAAIDAIADPLAKRKARNAWEYSSAVQRGNGLLAQLAPALGLTSEQLDNLFLEASKR